MSTRLQATGLALIAAATLMLEIILTRIFSVTMLYHMALVSVSMAMFGMTAGALIVHRWRERVQHSLGGMAVACALAILLSAWFAACVPVSLDRSLAGIASIVAWSAVMAIPFIFSGICVSEVLTRTPDQVGRLYAADLGGAAVACLGVVYVLNRVDAFSALIVSAALACTAGVAFAVNARRTLVTGVAVVALLAAAGGVVVNRQTHVLKLHYVLGEPVDPAPLRHEFWNVFSYITVSQEQRGASYCGPGLSASSNVDGSWLRITLDTRAATAMPRFDGNWQHAPWWLMNDVVSAVHWLRSDGPALVVGVGGGRDVMAALLRSNGKRDVTGIEINPLIVDLNRRLEADFAGHIADLPNVHLYTDEARSWVTRSHQQFQTITISLVDTFSASAAGAFALTENGLYTVEAMRSFYQHLRPDGILSVSRWWYGNHIGEPYRLAALMGEALRQEGVADPRSHVAVLQGDKLATFLVSRAPFSTADLDQLQETCNNCGFTMLLSPRDTPIADLASAVEDPAWPARPYLSDMDFSPPTDDRPFFFHLLRWSALPRVGLVDGRQQETWRGDANAVTVLAVLTAVVTLLAVAVLGVPLAGELRTRRPASAQALLFFALIGLGFMLVESAQMQRLSIFLGSPVYALTVVLFSLLLSSAIGAALAPRLSTRTAGLLIIGVLAVVGVATPPALHQTMGADTAVRIAVAVALLAPAGLIMGTLFPLGLTQAAQHPEVSLPWCWGVNGMMATCASIYSISFALSMGLTATYWLAVLCYGGAVFLLGRLAQAPTPAPPQPSPLETEREFAFTS